MKEEIQEPLLVEEKEDKFATEEELSMEKRQAKEHHPLIRMENVLVGINIFNFPIDCVIVGMEEKQQVSFIKTPSTDTSQAWIDIKHGEMTLLVGKERVKFNLNQSIQLTDEEKMKCMWIKSSLLHFEKKAPRILQGVTLEGSKININSFPTKELGLEPLLIIPEMEELILMKDEDGEGALATKDEGSKQRSSTFPMSLVGL